MFCFLQSVQACKNLMRRWNRDDLLEANRKETEVLYERWQSEDCAEAILKFFSKRSRI